MDTIKQTKEKIIPDPLRWKLYFFDFVDDFRYYKDAEMIAEPFALSDDKMDALLASTVEYLCDELKIEASAWLKNIKPCLDRKAVRSRKESF